MATPEPRPIHENDGVPRVIDANDLLQGQRELVIRHQEKTYRLRITRRNKLILTGTDSPNAPSDEE